MATAAQNLLDALTSAHAAAADLVQTIADAEREHAAALAALDARAHDLGNRLQATVNKLKLAERALDGGS